MTNPRSTGAIIPSSHYLAELMVSQIKNKDQKILELGAGTGVITKALLHAGFRSNNITVVETSAIFVKNLREQFPNIRIIEGDAANLTELLGEDVKNVQVIISSIPLRSLPKSVALSILQHIKSILPKNGRYIQFTYSLTYDKDFSLDNCELIFSKRIWLNLPPARVDVWVKK